MLTTQSIDPNNRPPRFRLVRWIVAAWHWVVPPTQAHEDRESEIKRKVRVGVVAALFLGFIITVLVYERELKTRINEWRASRYVEKARKYADEKDIGSAINSAMDAVRVAPDYEPGVRLNAQLLTAIGRSEALYFWGKLERGGSASVDDVKGKVRALLKIGRPREARDQLIELLKSNPNDKELPIIAEEVLGKQEANSIVLETLKRHAAASPDDRDAALRLGNGQLLSHDPKEIESGRKGLWNLASGDDEISHKALRLLAGLKAMDLDERKRLASRLDDHPLADGEDHCLALSLRLNVESDRRYSLIDEATEKWFKGKKGERLLPFVRWLVMNNEPQRVLSLINVDDVKRHTEDRELLLNYLNALSWLGRFKELGRLLADEDVPLSRGERTYFVAHLAASEIFARPEYLRKIQAGAVPFELLTVDESDDLKRKFNAALNSLINEGRWDLLLSLGEHLSSHLKGLFDIAEDAFRSVAGAGNVRLERRAVEGWMRSSRRAGSTENLRKASERGVLRWPDDTKFAEELLYVDFLQGVRVESSLTRANTLLQGSPNDSPRKLITALGFWRIGDTENAIAACQEIKLDEVNLGQMAVFAGIFLDAGPAMTAAGDVNQFRSRLEAIINPIPPNAALLPEESAILDRARAEILRLRGKAQAGL